MSTAYTLTPSIFLIDDIDQKFWRITRKVFIVFIVVSLIVPLLPVFELSREKQTEIPERVAKVLMQKRQQEKKPVPLASPQPEKKKQIPKKKDAVTPKKTTKPKPKPTPTLKERVGKVGLLAMRDDLQALRETPVLKRISNPNRKLSSSGSVSAVKEYKPVTRNVSKGSGGVSTKGLKRETMQTQLAERKLSKVDSRLASLAEADQKGDARDVARTIEEIRLVLERHKGSFNILYTKQLRRDPGLRGKVLFELTIAPSGKVTNCRIIESALNFPSLERKFVLKFRSIDFGEKDVGTTIINYPLDFFPS